jgi:hypothetical protein
MPGKRVELRQAYASLLRERVARNAPAVPIPPPRVAYLTFEIPIERGCLFCGVSHKMVPAVVVAREGLQSVARDLWTPKRTGTQRLGGQPSPQQLSGHLCRVCADAVEHVHSVGPSALERALVVALVPEKLGRLSWGNLRVDGLIGWAVLVTRARQQNPPAPDPAPNSRSWEHLADISEMSDELRTALGG